MWAILIAFGFVGSLVKVAYEQSIEPTLRPAWRRAKLARLARVPDRRLKIDQAEDGMVLAREFEAPELEAKFRKVAAALKKKKRI